MPPYKVLTGLDYKNIRREPGDIADDIPKQSIQWLLEQGAIEPIAEES